MYFKHNGVSSTKIKEEELVKDGRTKVKEDLNVMRIRKRHAMARDRRDGGRGSQLIVAFQNRKKLTYGNQE